MNTPPLTAKARLFSLYLGQKVFLWKYPEHCAEENMFDTVHGEILDKPYWGSLLLRSIADLMEEEIIQVIMLDVSAELTKGFELVRLGRYKGSPFIEWKYEPNDERLIVDGKHSYCESALLDGGKDLNKLTLKQSDYLRSIGIALPTTVLQDGKPITYSVEQQIEFGWVRLADALINALNRD